MTPKDLPELHFTLGAPSLEADLTEERNQCHLFKLVKELEQNWTGDEDGLKSIPLSRSPHQREMKTCTGKPGWWVLNVKFDSVLASTILTRFINSDPLSNSSIIRMKDWINSCSKGHTQCKPRGKIVPSRLLDVAGEKVRLVENVKFPEMSYATLSHCWGTSKPFITTKETYSSRTTGFDLEEVPRTFRDAILLTRRLGLQYLWIDSLCILQGDVADWQTEGSKMADIYANCYVCFIASEASSDTEGFLSPRDINYIALTITSKVGASTKIYLQDGQLYEKQRAYAEFKDPGPLATRGWCWQERILPGRRIGFYATGSYWECQEYSTFEGQEKGGFFDKHCIKTILPSKRVNNCQTINPAGNDLNWGSWANFIRDSSVLALTYEGDKLPALSGLAKVVAEETGATYCAGLWREDLPAGLLWGVGRMVLDLKRPAKWRAPSWSWASVDSAITYPDGFYSKAFESLSNVELNNVYVDVDGSDPFGQVSAAWIVVSAPLIALSSEIAVDFQSSDIAVSKTIANITIRTYLDDKSKGSSENIFALPLIYEFEYVSSLYGILVRQTQETPGFRGAFSMPCSQRVGWFVASPKFIKIGESEVVKWDDEIQSLEAQQIALV